jgi:glutaconate CoA-transferase, subunit A
VPGGAHPSYAHGYYKRDNAFYKAWDAISRDRDGFLAWMKANVLEQGPGAFAVHSSHTAGKSARANAGKSTQPARATDAAE